MRRKKNDSKTNKIGLLSLKLPARFGEMTFLIKMRGIWVSASDKFGSVDFKSVIKISHVKSKLARALYFVVNAVQFDHKCKIFRSIRAVWSTIIFDSKCNTLECNANKSSKICQKITIKWFYLMLWLAFGRAARSGYLERQKECRARASE